MPDVEETVSVEDADDVIRFDPQRPVRKIQVVRRDVSFETDIIPLPDASWDDERTFVKFLTPMVYMRYGGYVVGGWDLTHDKPGVLIINHSIFPQLRDWHRDFMRPMVGTTFMFDFWMQKGLVYHRVTSMGMAPELDDVRRKAAADYIDGLFGEDWVKDDSAGPEWVSVAASSLQQPREDAGGKA
jgi:hypothetical protein